MKQSLRQFSDEMSVKTRHINGLHLSDAIYPPALRQPRHTHKFASFSFVLSGNYLEIYNGSSFLRKSSTVIFHPPEESHAVNFQTNVRILNVEFDFARLAYLREHLTVLDEPASRRTETINYLGQRIYREFQSPDAFSALAIEGLILEILAEAARSKVRSGEKNFPRWLDQTKDFLHANFAETFLVEDVAKIAGVHPVHLSRVFRQKFGCTIGEYVRRLRVELAERQISATETPLSEIALAAGFSDQSHLNKTFKSVFGRTPANHRKISRQS
jgi:AraC family transcriptional regulator